MPIINKNKLRKLREKCNAENKKIVLANGCFDLLHIGHINYLREAKQLGDILVVALNSDKSVRKIKGKGRPIMPQNERAELLCSLKYVDYVVIFDEDNVIPILKELRPDFHCKGSDYTVQSIPEKSFSDANNIKSVIVGGDKIQSSSNIIKNIIENFK
jgi:rfaE bifunctional protein nucleotidyltransferase chain/domain